MAKDTKWQIDLHELNLLYTSVLLLLFLAVSVDIAKIRVCRGCHEEEDRGRVYVPQWVGC